MLRIFGQNFDFGVLQRWFLHQTETEASYFVLII